jgi:hypothetical protein
MVGGDWDFRDDLLACNTLSENYRAAGLSQPTTRTGLLPNKYGLGWAVVSVPFYLIADGVVEIGRLAGWWTLARDGFNPVYQVALQTGHFALAVLALFLVHRVLRRWCGPDAAMRGLCLGWACSPMLYYQTSNLSMSQTWGSWRSPFAFGHCCALAKTPPFPGGGFSSVQPLRLLRSRAFKMPF